MEYIVKRGFCLNNKDIVTPSVFFPPGGILIWIIISVEVLTFFMGIGSMLMEKRSTIEDFSKMQSSLDSIYAVWNTIFLLTSGYAMAVSVTAYENLQERKFSMALLFAIIFGLLFLGLKGWEYAEKLNSGLDLHAGTFWGYYWFLTGFHFLHVVAGIIILTIVFFSRHTISPENLEAGASFWHMCDLIWVVLFPVLYLIH